VVGCGELAREHSNRGPQGTAETRVGRGAECKSKLFRRFGCGVWLGVGVFWWEKGGLGNWPGIQDLIRGHDSPEEMGITGEEKLEIEGKKPV